LLGIGQQAFAIIQAASARLDHHYIVRAGLQQVIDLPEQLSVLIDDLQTFQLVPVVLAVGQFGNRLRGTQIS
jgi:hypothetical protein